MINLDYDEDFWPPVHVGSYPNGEPYVKGSSEGVVGGILVRPKDLGEFVTAMFYVDALRHRGHPVDRLYLPLVPGSRMDRLINDEGADQLFTLKSVAKMINDRNFRYVGVADPHSIVTSALLDRCFALSAATILNTPTIRDHGYQYVIAPDAGAVKRANEVADLLDATLIVASKTRSTSTGALSRVTVPQIKGFKVLVVDDLCDGGATFLHLSTAMGPDTDADLYVTHGLFTNVNNLAELATRYNRIITTNSTVLQDKVLPNNLHVIDIFQGALA